LIADNMIQMVLSTDDYSEEWAAETLWPSGVLRAYDIFADDGGFWVDCLCSQGWGAEASGTRGRPSP